MTNSELEAAIMAFGKRCSNISRIYSIGASVNGVPLWVIEISDKPGQEEAESAFKCMRNVHGDEPVGRELLLLLANWICDNYLKDPLATLIVESVHLHILPSMFDGFSLLQRGNANNIDLNRDFLDQVKTRRIFADYHRLLASGGRYIVIANVPGYRSKTTHIWLEEAATTVDFVLDPEVTPKGNLLESACECNCGRLSSYGFVDFFHIGPFEMRYIPF